MAYSAALGETDPRYYDTQNGVLAHPLFPVCYEWPLAQPLRALPALQPLFPRLLHAQHDLTLHRLPRAGETLRVSARIAGAEQRRPGAFVVFRFEARDAANKLVTVTNFGALYRGAEVDASAGERMEDPGNPEGELQEAGSLAIPANLAHVYTECARVWNPIHTDVAYARAAGLPGLILHGTATLALSVSRVLRALGSDPARVRRIRCRFSGMVFMPSTLKVYIAPAGAEIGFETRDERGEAVIRRGSIALA
jgi:acyl dehydratase